jgi:hypothetical protein
VALVERLLQAEQARLQPLEQFLLEGGTVNPYFAVLKGDNAQRLIIDARPANAGQPAPPNPGLPTPDLWTRLVATGSFYVAKSDLSNFYHAFRVPLWMQRCFGLPPVQGLDFGLPRGLYVPVCTTLPMGYSHAVYLAQAAHRELILSCTLLRAEDEITDDNDFRLDRVRWLVYIDDVVIFAPPEHLAAARAAFDSYLAAAKQAAYAPKQEKIVDFTDRPVSVLGFSVEGATGMVFPDPDKLVELMRRTQELLDRKVASPAEFQSLLGCWNWVFLLRRPFFAVFSAVYSQARILEEGKGSVLWAVLWKEVRKELRMAMSLAPLLRVDMSLPWAADALASDASSFAGGVCAAPIDPALATHLLKYAGRGPSAYSGGLTEALAVSETLGEWRWRTLFSMQWRRSGDHINVLEMRALLSAVRRAACSPAGAKKRLLALVDSTVALGVASKGRSSSRRMLRVARALTAALIAHDLTLAALWISTHFNPADAPSRNRSQ